MSREEVAPVAYATVEELQAYLRASQPPTDAERLLERASELIDYATLYRAAAATERHAEDLKRAVCAQVEFWLEAGEAVDVLAPQGNVHIGSLIHQAPGRLAPRAMQALLPTGLLARGVCTW